MLIKEFVILSTLFFLSIFTSNSAATDLQLVTISVPQSLNIDIKKLINLQPGQRINLEKSLLWRVDGKEFYFLAISYFKKNKECKFTFVDKLNKKIISDGGFNFEKCSFLRPPEILDINLDGYMDFKVWVRIPHHFGSQVLVDHNLNFIYDPKISLFCESNIGIPCI